MRPGVYASVMRNRKTNVRRVQSSRHVYSWRRFFVLLFAGALLFIPGLIVTIIGLDIEDVKDLPDDSVLYKVIGPAGLAFGIALICSAGIYYCCWGFQSPVRRRHIHKHKKSTEHKEQQDPLQPYIYRPCTCKKFQKLLTTAHDFLVLEPKQLTRYRHPNSVPSISSQSHVTANASRRSKESTCTTKFSEELDRINSSPTSPDIRSCRHGQHYPNHHVHPTSPKPHHGDGMSHRCSSRHRSCSQSPHTRHKHSHHSYNHHSQSDIDNQVPFINTNAPLAQGESGSMDISIDLSTEVPSKGLKY